jgi:hypothetical protein
MLKDVRRVSKGPVGGEGTAKMSLIYYLMLMIFLKIYQF